MIPSQGVRATRVANKCALMVRMSVVVSLALLLLGDLRPAYASGTWAVTDSMAERRAIHTAVSLADGRVLVVGGTACCNAGGSYSLDGVESYSPIAGTWAPAASLKEDRFWSAGVRLGDGRVLVVGGSYANGSSGGDVAAAEIFDPEANQWQAAGELNLASPRAVRLVDGRVLVVGDSRFPQLFDPITETWSPAGEMNVGRTGPTLTLLSDGSVLAVGGFSCSPVAERYDPHSNSWSLVSSMAEGRQHHRAALLTDGRVLVAGGICAIDQAPRSSVEVFDPGSNSWSAGASLSLSRSAFEMVSLQDGRILVVGGATGPFFNVPTSSAEIFDELIGSWQSAGTMVSPRVYHTATVLPSGEVLVAGGEGSGLSSQWDSAELFTPESIPGEVVGPPFEGSQHATSCQAILLVTCTTTSTAEEAGNLALEAVAFVPSDLVGLGEARATATVSTAHELLEPASRLLYDLEVRVDDGSVFASELLPGLAPSRAFLELTLTVEHGTCSTCRASVVGSLLTTESGPSTIDDLVFNLRAVVTNGSTTAPIPTGLMKITVVATGIARLGDPSTPIVGRGRVQASLIASITEVSVRRFVP
jgi:Kelch motif protein